MGSSYCSNDPVDGYDPSGMSEFQDNYMRWAAERREYRKRFGSGKQEEYALWKKQQDEKNNPQQSLVDKAQKKNGVSKSFNTSGTIINWVKTGGGAFCDIVSFGASGQLATNATVAKVSYAVSTPLFIAAHWANEDLLFDQKMVMTSYEILSAAGGVALAYGISNIWNPTGWVGVLGSVAITLTYTYLTSQGSNWLVEYYTKENQKDLADEIYGLQ
ncbi:hypothetical protein I4300191C4_15640 [Solibaculum mannosilyticum]|uniref:Uncharacterized protein n=2 Tax=Solibaculum mannosilyticum TaxID=2780922 RepID=A0A7I8D2I6_9FIRM|nr:hypothetical protein C12CBH8_16350 [Solibaculum mannosilyticum]CZT55507.1 hypothetical protein BN3661_00586 [Eubacteriaceae bacterium CHKCI005]